MKTAATNTIPTLVGPSLLTLTTEQITELLKIVGLTTLAFAGADDASLIERYGPSLHAFGYVCHKPAKFETQREHLELHHWVESGGEDAESEIYSLDIYTGEICGHYGDSMYVLPVIHWFLSNGWTWNIAPTTEPQRVRLTDDFLDFKTGMGYPKGTVLVRSRHSGQYMLEGTRLGGECVAGFFLIKDICESIAATD